MKENKGLKLTCIILMIILLAMVSFAGIYVQDKNEMKNILPEYALGRELKGYRKLELKVSDKIEKTIKYDAEGNEIPDNDVETHVETTKEIKVNHAEDLTSENYQKVKQIIEKRLAAMQVKDYILKQDLTNGSMILELPENKHTDRVVGQLYLQGKFEIIDYDTNEVLMTNSDLKSVKGGYGTNSNGVTAVFINIQFNQEGTEKFKNITNTYTQTTVTKEDAETKESKEEKVTKDIAIKIDGSTLLTTYFDEEVSNGLLQLSVGSSSNSTAEQLQDYLLEATSMAAVLNAEKMPIVYEVAQNRYVFSMITGNEIKITIAVVITILTIGIIYMIIKYKTKGMLGGISLIGYIALLLLALRYFNVEISIGGMATILFSILMNYAMILSLLKQKERLEVIKKYMLLLIPTFIIAIIFTFMNIAMGVTLFWGILIGFFYQISVTNMLLKD